jgi:hypothetical protein
MACIPDCDKDQNGKNWPAPQQVAPTDAPVRDPMAKGLFRERCTEVGTNPDGTPKDSIKIAPPNNKNTKELKPPGVK